MALLFSIIGWLLLVVLALVCLALITPVFVKVHLTTLPKFGCQIEMRALAGLTPRLTMAQGLRKGPVAKIEAKHSTKPARSNGRAISSRMGGQGAVVRALPTLIGAISNRVHLTKLHIDADYGLCDPAETGRLCGLLMVLQYAVRIPKTVSLDLRPDFTKPSLNGSLTVVFHITVAALLIPLALFAWRAYGPRW